MNAIAKVSTDIYTLPSADINASSSSFMDAMASAIMQAYSLLLSYQSLYNNYNSASGNDNDN